MITPAFLDVNLEWLGSGRVRLFGRTPASGELEDVGPTSVISIRVAPHSVPWLDGPLEVELSSDVYRQVAVLLEGPPIAVGAVIRSPLCVFVSAPADHAWEDVVRHVLGLQFPIGRFQVVRRRAGRALPRPAPDLPIRIAVLGDDAFREQFSPRLFLPEMPGALAPERLIVARSFQPELARTVLRDEGAEIVVARSDMVAEVLRLAQGISSPRIRRPRVIVGLGREDDRMVSTTALVPAGVAVVGADLEGAEAQTGFARGLAEAFEEDAPLHVAVAHAAAATGTPADRVNIIADPATNVGVPMRGAAALAVSRELLRSASGARAFDPEAFSSLDPARRGRIESLMRNHGLSSGLLFSGRHVVPSAARSAGEIAEIQQQLREQAAAHEPMVDHLTPALRDPAIQAELSAIEERRVDVGLWRTDPRSLAPLDLTAAEPLLWLTPTTCLAARQTYWIRIHIGARDLDSLVGDPPPAIDGALPATEGKEGHRLDVTLESADFDLRGTSVHELFLPRTGQSDWLSIAVRTPSTTGPAVLRITIDFRQHVVQVFELRARVGIEEVDGDDPVLVVHGVYSRSNQLDNLDDLEPRALRIGLGTHHVSIKRHAAQGEASLRTPAVARAVSSFRKLLQEATYSGTSTAPVPRFETFPDPTTERSALFAHWLGRLARVGFRLHHGLIQQPSPILRDALHEIADSDDETIQVVRYDVSAVYPWAAVYDFGRPTDDSPERACPGWRIEGQDLAACEHRRGDGVLCGRGFWGVRHAIEELVGVTAGGDPKPRVQSGETGPRLHLVSGIENPATATLETELESDWGTQLRVLRSGDDLLEALFDRAQRPEVWVALGHLERVASEIPEAPEERITELPASPGYLSSDDITERTFDCGEWGPPRSIVFLMACESLQISPETLSNFAAALLAAGATAVVGAEAVNFSSLSARCARELATALLRGKRLGRALTDFRRTLLAERNPLGFVFSALGEGDARLR